jgi:hypothetical protein
LIRPRKPSKRKQMAATSTIEVATSRKHPHKDFDDTQHCFAIDCIKPAFATGRSMFRTHQSNCPHECAVQKGVDG